MADTTTTTTKFANRYGLDIKVLSYDNSQELMTIDFANSCALDVSGERVWATGGQAHANMIGFNNPVQGTLTVSTQVMTKELLALIAGYDEFDSVDTIEIVNNALTAPKFFKLEATTVWQDTSGNIHNETLSFHKVTPQKAYNITYAGEGDPTSVDVVFDVLQDDNGKVLTVSKAAEQ